MKTITTTHGRNVRIFAEDLDALALEQIDALSALPGLVGDLALMADAHAGKGVPIGTVFGTEGLVVPDVISGDIGCGMILMKTTLRADALARDAVRAALARVEAAICKTLHPRARDAMPAFTDAAQPVVAANAERAAKQLGTLGSGNHFCELQRDADGALWVMVHSGSRGLGQAVNARYHALADALCARLGAAHPKGFPFLPSDSDEGKAYVAEHDFCLRYAEANRELIRAEVELALRESFGAFDVTFVVQTHHNFLSRENWDGREVWVHRKGSVAAPAGRYVTIPGSMETRSFLCRGTGCALSMASVSHGAGRKTSRGKMLPKVHVTDAAGEVVRDKGGFARVDHAATAKARAEAAAAMLRDFAAKDIALVTRAPEEVLDERGHAYKDVDAVIRAQRELLEVVAELTPLGVVKSG